ncbi:uncharacterized protein KY384_006844 [Bacidia gigantensis]|uniref:uncharacterized protein n=1 Tax=Bacidia gigantensis TaxID=2732470 RepID=UPI001D051553|nr:uncharacterized protein KY384_006844 [Bacidia gigantensis]KAG8527928.1 hypothetical protein KY384_006844 [Bacidia gigantensis]
MNHAAVRSVSMRTLNRQRANIVFSEYITKGKVLTPKEVSTQENIFEWDGILRWQGSTPIGKAQFGASLTALLKPLGQAMTSTGAVRDNNLLPRIVETCRGEQYLLSYSVADRTAYIVLKSQCSPPDQIKAWVHALLIAQDHESQRIATSASPELAFRLFADTHTKLNTVWNDAMTAMKAAGWDLDTANIPTKAGVRIDLPCNAPR